MIQNLVFDLGGVLIDFDIKYYISRCANTLEDQVLVERELFRCVEWIQMDRGTISATDAIISMNQRLPKRLHHCTSEIILGWYENIHEIKGMSALIEEWKRRGYCIYLLSNTTKAFQVFRERISALKFFDGEFISAYCGFLKPEHEIYELFCNQFGLVPSDCVFIDNDPANVESAIRIGMAGVVFHGDASELNNQLSKMLNDHV